MICRCSSESTSFMLAALRVLHVDTTHAPAGIARIEDPTPPRATWEAGQQTPGPGTTRMRPREERPAI
jgi:hypothetical protein